VLFLTVRLNKRSFSLSDFINERQAWLPALKTYSTEERDGVARTTITRLDKYGAFRGKAVDDLDQAFLRMDWKRDIWVIMLTGAGDRAFCTARGQGVQAFSLYYDTNESRQGARAFNEKWKLNFRKKAA